MGGGGSKQPSEQTVTQNTIPKELMPYASQLMGRAQALTDINQNPFQAYAGQRVADINPLMAQGFGATADLGPSEQMFQGSGLSLAGGLGSLNTGHFGANEASDYMSPYIRNVLDVQKNEAMRDYARQSPQMAAGAARYGGIGGSRGAIAQSEGMRNLNNSLQNIDATGMQKAYESAQGQYNTEQQRRMAGLQQAITAGANLGQLGQNIYSQRSGAAQAQQAAGAALRDIEQNRLNAQYEQFGEEKKYPYEQLAFMSDILHGVPTYQSAQTSYKAPPSMLSQVGGMMTGLGGLYMAGKQGGG